MLLALLPGVASADHLAPDGDFCSAAADASFPDVAEGGVFEAVIECGAGFGFFQGDTEGNFNPGTEITRGEAAIIVANFVEISLGEDLPQEGENPFSDVSETGEARDEILKLVEADVIEGTTSTTYEPQANITRGESAALVYRALEFLGVPLDSTDNDQFSDIDGGIFENEIEALANFDGTPQVVQGFDDGTFRPALDVLRGEFAQLITEAAYQANEAGLFDPIGPDENEFTVVDDGDGFASGDLDIESNADNSTTQDVVYIEAGNSYTVDGVSASAGAFQAALTVGDTLVVSDTDDDGDFDTFALTNVAPPSNGVVGAVDVATNEFSIVTLGNNILTSFDLDTDLAAGGATYSVDGTSATQTAFLANIQHGDTVAVTLDDDEDVTAVALTNGTVTGTVDNAEADDDGDDVTFTIGLLGDSYDDSIATDTDTLFDADSAYGTAQTYSVDGATATITEFETAITDGDTISVSRSSGVEAFVLANVEVDDSFTGVTVDGRTLGVVDGADPIVTDDTTIALLVDGAYVEHTYATGASFRVNGTVSTLDEFEAAVADESLPVGETVTYTESTNTYSLTQATDTGVLPVTDIVVTNNAAADDSVTVSTAATGGQEIGIIPNNFTRVPLAAVYFVNGTAVSVDVFDDALAAADTADDGNDTFQAVVTGTTVEHRFVTDDVS